MTRKSTDPKLDQLKADVATTTTGNDNEQIASDPVAQLAADHERLREELARLKSGMDRTIDKGGEELKSEIVRRPLQSVVTAFAVGFAASLLLRR